jgi:predicted Zn-dependent peptidase
VKARETLRTDLVQSFQGLHGLLGVAAELVANGVPFDTLAKDVAKMQAATPADLNAAAGAMVRPESGSSCWSGTKG